METPESIEAKLGRLLIPRGFSDRGRDACDSLIDELAASAPEARRDWRPFVWLGGLAAVLAMTFSLMVDFGASRPGVQAASGPDEPNGLALLSETEGVVSAEVAGERLSESDGSLFEPWQIRVVAEERFRDEETGEEIRVWQPREELVLVPVSTF